MYGDQTVLVQKHNRPGVIVMSEREYESLRDPRKRFSSKTEWEAFFELTEAIRSRMSEKNQEAFDTIIDEEVQAVRAQKRTAAH